MAKNSIAEPVSFEQFSGDDTENAGTVSSTDDGNIKEAGTEGTGEETGAGTGTETGGYTEPPKRRGRPAGGTNKEKTCKDGIKNLSSLLFVIHVSLASLTKSSSLMLTEDECNRLAESTTNVMRHYNIGMTEKQRDLAAFAFCAGTIYAPRLYALKQEHKDKKK